MAKNSVNIYSVKGDIVKSVELPSAFSADYRPDIIHRAAIAEQANRRQPYGPSPKAGMRHAVSQWGKGRGTSRVQRLTQGNKAAESPAPSTSSRPCRARSGRRWTTGSYPECPTAR